ncbi:MAG TPA: hypothetical protein VFN74_17200 [Chloroflexota bacterium]|jgi:hypothetical protein|nr:hypothetical protein [Chloroflexota bacterium]
MSRTHFMAVAVAGVVLPAFAIVTVAAVLGAYVSQEVALAGVATLALVSLCGSARSVTRR